MADYNCWSRTNYFKTTNVDKLKELVKKIGAELWEGPNQTFAFGNDQSICEYHNEETGDYVEIFNELKELIPESEAVLLTEVGHEKLSSLVGICIIVTRDTVKTIDLYKEALSATRLMLDNPMYKTRIDY